MIRVNLLRKDQKLPIEPGGSSAFISGREVLLAGTFLILGGLILWFVLGDSVEPALETAEIAPVEDASTAPPPPSMQPAANASAIVPTEPLAAADTPVSTTPALASEVEATAESAPIETAEAKLPEPEAPRPSTILSSRTASAAPAAKPSPLQAPSPAAMGTTPSPDGVNTLRALRVEPAGDSLQILALADRAPEYKMFRVDHPDRVVIDIRSLRLDLPRESREQKISHPVVRGLRIAQNQIEPPVVRLVLEVSSFPELEIVPRADGLQINISAKP